MSTINLSEAQAFEVRGQTIWVDNGTSEAFFRIPKSAKVSLYKRAHTATINVGTFGKITITVTGPKFVVLELFESLTGHSAH